MRHANGMSDVFSSMETEQSSGICRKSDSQDAVPEEQWRSTSGRMETA
ncbi:hypothetical protein UNH65_30550 [Chitinophaga sp. 180180018-2]|nr:hypothetical protein [Chitinophaga sp. 212800010-3]